MTPMAPITSVPLRSAIVPDWHRARHAAPNAIAAIAHYAFAGDDGGPDREAPNLPAGNGSASALQVRTDAQARIATRGPVVAGERDPEESCPRRKEVALGIVASLNRQDHIATSDPRDPRCDHCNQQPSHMAPPFFE